MGHARNARINKKDILMKHINKKQLVLILILNIRRMMKNSLVRNMVQLLEQPLGWIANLTLLRLLRRNIILQNKSKSKLRDGGIYTGMIINNMDNGLGRLVMTNDDIYEGSFINNKLEGEGKYLYARGTTYTGQFKQGKSYGLRIEVRPEGSVYDGEFLNGKKDGKGFINGVNKVRTMENGQIT
ncbi:unnamed protein product (macronuclear) [Paramecium tetraurelia]|uniref:MORN repeat protein n=1 Tax=Paramecium tetraurelia TaxID=5888 RepID=A0ED94_PARTE|nr:uncharacterized protein GSPATT00004130001 [Paramecium tetraurelia]CAK93261.1 unnamed protein product [Paramecium tetraurelia]|eukprot:XP_001460658.1 hypothetical protein (macronuclear) [Paramecium tetraurelia strain d4-2]